MDALAKQFSTLGLSVKPIAEVKHEAATTPATWKSSLESAQGVPSNFELLKTLVFKFKQAGPKSAPADGSVAPVALVLVARESTDTSLASTALAKKLGLKDMRLAGADLLQDVFGLDKDSLSPFALSPSSFPKTITVLDSNLGSTSTTNDAPLAVRASSSSASVIVSASDIVSYLRALEASATGVKVTEVDFVQLKGESASADPGKAPASKEKQKDKSLKEEAKIEGAKQIAIGVKKEVDFATWYTNVLLKADMLDYYSVSGCYILKPWSYNIWEAIQEWFNFRIKLMGVENSYFPMFVSQKVLEREKKHLEGFSPEVAWVTRAGNSDLEEPIAIRPTSETAMYPYYAKWIKSHRDLPLKLNQWNSVVRWEFKNPQPFLRTREFLWQEGHTAHLTKAEADTEVREILELYKQVYEDLLAVPVIPGVKSEKEKFAGADYTTTVEGFVPTSGRGIQGATSHCLGQNFSKMFNIVVEDPDDNSEGQDKRKIYAYQNSWGLSTRAIGVMVMVHGDNQGLVLPPRVASLQAVLVPCGLTVNTSDAEKKRVLDECDRIAKTLVKEGIKAKADLRDRTPGWKFNDWEQKGVPLRLELGPGDMAKNQVIAVRRDNGVKAPVSLDGLPGSVHNLLNTIHKDMYERAKAAYDSHIVVCTKWEEVVPALDSKNVFVMPWCEEEACEDEVKERSGQSSEPQDARAPSAGAKSLCIPFDQSKWPAIEPGKTKCPQCGKDAKRWTMFGRSY
ncbi:prolyl-tRNA synthetase [Schizopora paradoxa]|uniref:proline--tRNA ligase n=1 Tax=Schizopora paradoxa TaxID=27342 RepID=A0A0H2S7L0_9AGAM|nr:prolyl-tRNA synthetase [Schizopora paradoxa]